MSVMPELGRLKQENEELEANLGYRTRNSLFRKELTQKIKQSRAHAFDSST